MRRNAVMHFSYLIEPNFEFIAQRLEQQLEMVKKAWKFKTKIER